MSSEGLQHYRAAVLVGLLLACAAPAAAQPADAPAAVTGVVSYPASFYAPGQPSSAREMIERTPGFVLDRGHYFGESLTDDEKSDLIAFLKTL